MTLKVCLNTFIRSTSRIHPRPDLVQHICLLFFINEEKLTNFAGDNMIYAAKGNLNELLRFLEKESEVEIKWISDNNVIVNSKTFQVMIINRQNRSNHNCCLTINNVEIQSKEPVTRQGIKIDNKLNFAKHIYNL